MRLTVYTDYSLRLLMYLALKDDGLATIAEIAESYGISKNHLMKVAHQLGVAGYVATVRGRSGGLRLPFQINQQCIGGLWIISQEIPGGVRHQGHARQRWTQPIV